MNSEFTPARTGLSRVFLTDGRAGPSHVPQYHSCVRAQALAKGFGDITDIECPDPNRPGAYVKIGSYQSGEDRATITLEGRLALDLRSQLMQLASRRCAVDVQIHFGECEDLSDWNSYKKVLFLEEARINNYSTEDIGSLQTADEAAVNESVELSAIKVYDIVPLTLGLKAESVVTNEVIDVAVCDEVGCGECAEHSSGCERVFGVTAAAGGSPGTPPDILFSADGGLNWVAHDIDTCTTANAASGVACLSGYVVVPSQSDVGIHYAPLTDFSKFPKDPVWTRVTTGLVAGAGPTCIVSTGTVAFLGGVNGRIYKMVSPPAGVTVLENGSLAPTSNMVAIDALSPTFVVAVGNQGVILYSLDGEVWQLLATSPVGVGRILTAVALKSKREWWVGTDDGRLYFTEDQGVNWTERTFPGSGSGRIWDIVLQSDSIMYFSHATTAPRGRVFMSINGGYDFRALPLGGGLMPNVDRFTALAVCQSDPGLLVAGGLADNGTDGCMLLGSM